MGQPLIVIHDGAVDEFVALTLLGTPDFRNLYDLQAVIVTAGNCVGWSGSRVTRKALDLAGLNVVPVGLSAARCYNPYPWVYRQYGAMLDLLPVLPSLDDAWRWSDGDTLLADTLRAAAAPVTLLVLCPVTTLTDVLLKEPALVTKIEKIVWMGGVVVDRNNPLPQGNIDPGLVPGGNPNAEWNVYWDPFATQTLLEDPDNRLPAIRKVPIVDFSLAVTNAFPLTGAWVATNLNPYVAEPLVNFAAHSYAMVVPNGGYALWDVVTTIYLAQPQYFTLGAPIALNVTTEDGPDQGSIYAGTTAGANIQLTGMAATPEQVMDYFVSCLRSFS
jgi:purine nucleosidase